MQHREGGRRRQRGGEKGERFKVAAKLLRRRRGNILGLIVERRGQAGCAPGFEVLWRSSPSHKAPSLYLAIHLRASLQRERTRRGHGQLCRGKPECGCGQGAMWGDICHSHQSNINPLSVSLLNRNLEKATARTYSHLSRSLADLFNATRTRCTPPHVQHR